MAEFKEISPDALVAAKLMNWIDNRWFLSADLCHLASERCVLERHQVIFSPGVGSRHFLEWIPSRVPLLCI